MSRVPQSPTTSGSEQLQFLEELASLLQPEPPPQGRPSGGGQSRGAPTPPVDTETARTSGRDEKDGASSTDLLDPREYLNSAELMLLSLMKTLGREQTRLAERTPLVTVERKKRRTASLTGSVDQQPPPRGEGSASPSRVGGGCWLKESEMAEVRDWLRMKDRETILKMRAVSRERRRARREREEKDKQQVEREKQAKVAYQRWLQRKASEEIARKKVRIRRDDNVRTISQNKTPLLPQRPGVRSPCTPPGSTSPELPPSGKGRPSHNNPPLPPASSPDHHQSQVVTRTSASSPDHHQSQVVTRSSAGSRAGHKAKHSSSHTNFHKA